MRRQWWRGGGHGVLELPRPTLQIFRLDLAMPPMSSRVLPALPHTWRGNRQRLVLVWAMRRGLRGAYHHLDIADVAHCGSYSSLRDPASETTSCARGDRSNREQHDIMLLCWISRHRAIGVGVSVHPDGGQLFGLFALGSTFTECSEWSAQSV